MGVFLTELIEAFLVTMGYAFIFYLFIRKLQRSWPILVIMVATFSLFVMTMWWKKEGISSLDDIIGDVTGTYLAIMVLSLLFHYNSKKLEEPAKETPFLRPEVKKKKVRLRYLYQFGIIIEERGKKFYNLFAESAVDANVKKMFRKLAQDENRHKIILQGILNRWLALAPMDQEELTPFESQLNIRKVFLNHPNPKDTSDKEMIEYALHQEKEMANFYMSFEKAFPNQWKRQYVQMLIMEEKSHLSDLLTLYVKFKRPS